MLFFNLKIILKRIKSRKIIRKCSKCFFRDFEENYNVINITFYKMFI